MDRGIGRVLLAMLGLALATGAARAAEPVVARAAAPGWIDWLPMPAANPARMRQTDGGTYDLIVDDQVRMERGLTRSFRRVATKVIARSGLEGASVEQINVDPAFDSLVLHRVAVWRGGRMIDQTPRAAVEMLRREGRLDDGIVTGERTALVRLADVRVGDVVDVAWSWVEHRSSWPGRLVAETSLGWSVPVALTRYRLSLPTDGFFAGRQSFGLAQPARWREGPLTVREWRAVDPAPIRGEDMTPAWYHGWPRVTISTIPSWAAVAERGRRHFAGPTALPAAFAARVDAIARAHRDPAPRAIAALRLVQDEIRYTSLSIGDGGFVPRPPAQVIESGWGDCKDKSQLLAVVLRRLGIEAWPALTDSDEGAALPRLLPADNAFDHAIVLARIGGRDHWLDATMSQQGGTLATLAALPYGYALPLRPEQNRLVAIPNPVPAQPTIAEVATYRRDAAGDLLLTVVTTHRGDEADIKRGAIASRPFDDIERDYLRFYRGLYPGIRREGTLGIADDRDANRLVTTERYRLPVGAPDFRETLGQLELRATVVRDVYGTPDGEGRRWPLRLPWTIHRSSRIVLDLPDSLDLVPAVKGVASAAFRLDATAAQDGDRAVIDYRLVGRQAWLPAAQVDGYRDDVDALNDATAPRVDATPLPIDGDTLLIVGVVGLTAIGGLLWWLARRRAARRPSPPRLFATAAHVPRTAHRPDRDAA